MLSEIRGCAYMYCALRVPALAPFSSVPVAAELLDDLDWRWVWKGIFNPLNFVGSATTAVSFRPRRPLDHSLLSQVCDRIRLSVRIL